MPRASRSSRADQTRCRVRPAPAPRRSTSIPICASSRRRRRLDFHLEHAIRRERDTMTVEQVADLGGYRNRQVRIDPLAPELLVTAGMHPCLFELPNQLLLEAQGV